MYFNSQDPTRSQKSNTARPSHDSDWKDEKKWRVNTELSKKENLKRKANLLDTGKNSEEVSPVPTYGFST